MADDFQILIHLGWASEQPPSAEVLEECADRLLPVLEKSRLALGPAVSVDFSQAVVEVDLTIEGVARDEAFKRIDKIVALMEQELDCQLVYKDSFASRQLVPA